MINFSELSTRELIILRGMNKFLLKFTPFVAAVIYTLFCLLRALGIENYMITCFMAYAGIIWAPFHFASSYSQGFCVWHRRLIWYHGTTGMMVFLQMWIGFGEFRRVLNLLFFLWGLTVCAIVSYKIYRKQFCGSKDMTGITHTTI